MFPGGLSCSIICALGDVLAHCVVVQLFYSPFQLYNHLTRKERVSINVLAVIKLSVFCSLPRGVVG